MKNKEKISWNVRHYRELTADELYDMLRLRAEVFVVEQTCPYQDLDGLDSECHHIMGRTEDGHLVAYARILPEGVDPYELVGEGDARHGGIGRVVVAQSYRGIGHDLMDVATEAYHRVVGPNVPCIIHAQAHLKHFYEAHGFRQSSGVCIIDNIDHIEMTRCNTHSAAPDIEQSTREERIAFVREQWKCLHNCELCGKCHILKGRDEEELYADYIDGKRPYMDITLEIRK